jgi:hypothetical protein
MPPELTAERRASLLARLCDPFPPNNVQWRVYKTTKDQSRGEVGAYVKKLVYYDRLNQLFTTSGWTSSFVATNIQNVTRPKNNRTINTGKVVLICTVSIDGFGTHTSTGDCWADEENATTTAESQAFKRACAQFGLGRYLELLNNDKPWVDLDDRKQPRERPKLPDWALPRAFQVKARTQPVVANTMPPVVNTPPAPSSTQSPAGASTAVPTTVPTAEQKSASTATTSPKPALVESRAQRKAESELNKKFRLAKEEVGEHLFNDVVEHVKDFFEKGRYTGDRNIKTLECFTHAQGLIQKLRDLHEHVGDATFGNTLDEYNVPALNAFSTIDQLVAVVEAMEKIAA